MRVSDRWLREHERAEGRRGFEGPCWSWPIRDQVINANLEKELGDIATAANVWFSERKFACAALSYRAAAERARALCQEERETGLLKLEWLCHQYAAKR